MKRSFLGITCVLLIFSVLIISWKAETVKKTKKVVAKSAKFSSRDHFSQYLEDIYSTAQLNEAGLDMQVFQKAVTGFFNLKATTRFLNTVLSLLLSTWLNQAVPNVCGWST